MTELRGSIRLIQASASTDPSTDAPVPKDLVLAAEGRSCSAGGYERSLHIGGQFDMGAGQAGFYRRVPSHFKPGAIA